VRKKEWLGLNDEAVRRFHIHRLGLEKRLAGADAAEATRVLMEHLEPEQQSKDGPLGEMAATMVLHNGLRDKFFVVRASPHDDHEHGVDNLIINRATGEIVCGFDEVVGGADDPRVRAKEEKKRKAIARGGVRVDYGFTIDQGRVTKRSFDHLPVFSFRLEREEIDGLLTEAENGAAPGPQSKHTLERFFHDMDGQLAQSLAAPGVSPELKTLLASYRDGSLAEMREIVGTEVK
jgi:hypothetical protein